MANKCRIRIGIKVFLVNGMFSYSVLDLLPTAKAQGNVFTEF